MTKNKNWELLTKSTQDLNSDKIIEILLSNRQITTKSQKKQFLHPPSPTKISLKKMGIDPKEIAKAILWECLWELKLNAMPFIPDRFSDGYGFSNKVINNLKKQDPNLSLVITVDNGIVRS